MQTKNTANGSATVDIASNANGDIMAHPIAIVNVANDDRHCRKAIYEGSRAKEDVNFLLIF